MLSNHFGPKRAEDSFSWNNHVIDDHIKNHRPRFPSHPVASSAQESFNKYRYVDDPLPLTAIASASTSGQTTAALISPPPVPQMVAESKGSGQRGSDSSEKAIVEAMKYAALLSTIKSLNCIKED